MSPPLTKIILMILGMMLIARQAESAPIAAATNLTQMIEEFLNKLYGKLERKPDIYEQMQGDQPPIDENETANLTDSEYVRNMKNRKRGQDHDDRSKDTWIQVLKHNILRQIGRTDTPANATLNFPIANISTVIPQIYNNSTSSMHLIDADHITEKIRSYYPKCDPPPSLDPELLDSNLMNLYFNFDNLNHDEKFNIVATATLRLYRLVANGTGSAPEGTKQSSDCDSGSAATLQTSEEERLLRVTIYWYTRSLKKKRIKRKLCDSKMVSENASWVELSVKPATKQWARGRNLGLAVQVEDQEGNILKADKMFKGATCTPPPSQFQQLSSTQPVTPTNWTELIAYLEEIQQQPFVVTYQCSHL